MYMIYSELTINKYIKSCHENVTGFFNITYNQ